MAIRISDGGPISKREKFYVLRDQWQEETKYMSSASQIVEHPAYKEIVKMGEEVVPWIIDDIRFNATTFWWHALRQILQDGPIVPEYGRGKLRLINELWLAWYEYYHEDPQTS